MPVTFDSDVTVIGGAGHVGLPLAAMFADRGLTTWVYDTNADAVETIRRGRAPFADEGLDDLLTRGLASERLRLSTDPQAIRRSRHVIVVIGTPVDEHLNPTVRRITRMFEELMPHFADGQVVVLRSTLFPGVTERIASLFARHGRRVHVAYCPERVSQGRSIREIETLPQIVSGFDETAVRAASDLFRRLTGELIVVQPMEAELAKLFTNCWRYITFGIVNQFYMIAASFGLDFQRIYHAVTHRYPRCAAMPGPGFAAGPCLFKDTMQLAAFNNNNFMLGHGAMLVNEGLPNFVVEQLKRAHDLRTLTVGLLGMAFKAESDDARDSLSYKLRKILEFEARRVLATDPYVRDDSLVPLERVLAESDLMILATPHRRYADLKTDKPVVDIWNHRRAGPP